MEDLQEIEDGSASVCCAKEALRMALEQRYAYDMFGTKDGDLRFLQFNAKKNGETTEGVLERESLTAFITPQLPSGISIDEVEVPDWPIARWRSLRLSVTILDSKQGIIFRVWANTIVAKCNRDKLPSYVLSDLARGYNLDWAPIVVCFSRDSKGDKNGFDCICKFKHELLKCGVFNFSPISMTMKIED